MGPVPLRRLETFIFAFLMMACISISSAKADGFTHEQADEAGSDAAPDSSADSQKPQKNLMKKSSKNRQPAPIISQNTPPAGGTTDASLLQKPAAPVDQNATPATNPKPDPQYVTTAWSVRDFTKKREGDNGGGSGSQQAMGITQPTGRFVRPPHLMVSPEYQENQAAMQQQQRSQVQVIPAPVAANDWSPEVMAPQEFPARNMCPQPFVDRCPMIVSEIPPSLIEGGEGDNGQIALGSRRPTQLPPQLVIGSLGGSEFTSSSSATGGSQSYAVGAQKNAMTKTSSGKGSPSLVDPNQKAKKDPEQLYNENDPYVERYTKVKPDNFKTMADHLNEMEATRPEPANLVEHDKAVTTEAAKSEPTSSEPSLVEKMLNQYRESDQAATTTGALKLTPAPQASMPQVRSAAAPAAKSIHLATIYFSPKSDQLEEQDKAILRDVATIYQKQGGKLRVIGDIGETQRAGLPGDKDIASMAPSLRLADSVSDYLRQLGVSDDKLIVAAMNNAKDGDSAKLTSSSGDTKKRVEIHLQQ